MTSTDERPRSRFLLLRRCSGLTSEGIAREAGLPLIEKYRAEIGWAVEPDVAARLLAAFSRQTDKCWTLSDMALLMKEGCDGE